MESVPLSRRQKLNTHVVSQQGIGYPPTDIASDVQSSTGTIVTNGGGIPVRQQAAPFKVDNPVHAAQQSVYPQQPVHTQQPPVHTQQSPVHTQQSPKQEQQLPQTQQLPMQEQLPQQLPYPPYSTYSTSLPQANVPQTQAQYPYPAAEYNQPIYMTSGHTEHYYPNPYPPLHTPARPSSIPAHHTSGPQTLTSTYTSEKPRPPKSTSGPQNTAPTASANSFLNCLKDSMRALSFSDVAPALTLMSAAVLHHGINRKSGTMVPYQRSPWVKRINNALFAYNCYGFAKDNGFIKSRELETESTQRGMTATGTRDLLQPPSPDSMEPNMIQEIARSLFRSTPQGGNLVDAFDDRWAVPKVTAEHYYNLVYHTKSGIHNASVQMLGGAAAIKALCANHQNIYSDSNAAYKYEHMVMGIALSEATHLVLLQAEHGSAASNDTVQVVGKIALATLIKIKIDEGTGM
ncbi:hypothetical protein GGF49_003910 [Coemansia sp. RSA 1853]|nr:hypothetical protein LPJ76_004069 [Coemansia sp. RSA 638]KAJ2541144.1 hypothetical protein GGF49_003910 [Coemansia sp. RSA 1853]